MRVLAVAAIAGTALVLVATALYLHGGDTASDSAVASAKAGTGSMRIPPQAWSGRERTGRVEERPGQAGAAEPEPTKREEVQIDQQEFGSLYQAASALALATQDSNVTRTKIRDLIETLGTELSAANAKTPAEVQMVDFYAKALVAYRDGLQFWDLRRFADRPGESAPLDALASKYDIQLTSKYSYASTWQSYPNGFSKIWAVGNAATAEATAMYTR